ncbi:lipid-binding SYLF domain-containing protein [Geminicoccaceae bacterium 1502E]|nr:lipid-binding SYLF domain-containing protein [Geminicoccaceae bacterium 1502E]
MRELARRRLLGALALGTTACLLAGPAAMAQSSEQQILVDRARIVVEEFQGDGNFRQLPVYVQNAYAVMVIPNLLKAGFFIGAEYGKGVLLARDLRSGAWSDPAFFDVYGGSLGLQIGGKSSDVILTIMNQGAVDKLLSSQFKLGTDASVAAGPAGVGVGAGTTIQLGEDVYVFERGQGLYGGLTIEGTVFKPHIAWNQSYYGQPVAPQQILGGNVSNAGSAPLREALGRF